MFEDESHNEITLKRPDFCSANVFTNFKFFLRLTLHWA